MVCTLVQFPLFYCVFSLSHKLKIKPWVQACCCGIMGVLKNRGSETCNIWRLHFLIASHVFGFPVPLSKLHLQYRNTHSFLFSVCYNTTKDFRIFVKSHWKGFAFWPFPLSSLLLKATILKTIVRYPPIRVRVLNFTIWNDIRSPSYALRCQSVGNVNNGANRSIHRTHCHKH
jgi:hypothetical protein